jgi:amino acid adenylation domain-containing protein
MTPDDLTFSACAREQEGLWLLEQTHDVSTSNTMPVVLVLRGGVEKDVLERALRRFVERHAPLRTEFRVVAGRLRRRELDAAATPPVTVRVVRTAVEDVHAVVDELAQQRLDVLSWPPYRFFLVQAGSHSEMLVMVLHHCIFDGTSIDLARRDVAALYAAEKHGVSPSLPPVPSSYDDYVNAETSELLAADPEASAYWPSSLQLIENSLRIPTSGTVSGRSEARTLAVEPEVKAKLDRLARSHEVSLFLVLVAAVQAMQIKYAGGGDDGVATALAMDTRRRGMREAVGMYANEAPLYSDSDESQSFSEFLSQVGRRSRELFKLRRYPFTEAVARYGPGGDARALGAQVGITFLRSRAVSLRMAGVEVEPAELLPNGGARRLVMVSIFDEPTGLRVRFEYDTAALGAEIGARLGGHFRQLLGSLTSAPERRLSDVELLSADERTQLLVDWNDTRGAFNTERTVEAVVREQVARTPDRPAVQFRQEQLSYRELDERAEALGLRLRGQGVRRGDLVAVCAARSPKLIIALLGTLKAGAGYVPLDPDYPAERLQFMLEDSGATLVVADGDLAERFSPGRARVVTIDGELPEADQPCFVDGGAGPEDLAYVIYTSGSTGTPKGVAMSHRPLCNLLEWQRRRFANPEPARTLQFASVSFDVAFQEIFSTLCTGGCVVMVDADLRRDLARLATFIDEHRIERLFVPFLVVNELARHLGGLGPREAGAVEVITAGERLEITPAIRELWQKRRSWSLENQYGPTESHIVTAHRLEGEPAEWPILPPIGRPIANARIYVLDRRRRPVPVGIPGELYIGGIALARGYLHRPELTAERFLPDPFAGEGGRMYRTGDVARWDSDGHLEFLGRVDDQLKVRGFRVEPGEIESTLVKHPAVREAAVVGRDDGSGVKRLVAYLVPARGSLPSGLELRQELSKVLPDHMVPAAFVEVAHLPLTPNGKLDRRSLPEPTWAPGRGGTYVAPGTPTEERLVEIWARTLGLAQVGVEDNFFELGGHSLLAGQVVARARDELGHEIPLRLMFSGPTVRELAARIDELKSTDLEAPIRRVPRRTLDDILAEG